MGWKYWPTKIPYHIGHDVIRKRTTFLLCLIKNSRYSVFSSKLEPNIYFFKLKNGLSMSYDKNKTPFVSDVSSFTRQLGLTASCRIAADPSSTHGVLLLYQSLAVEIWKYSSIYISLWTYIYVCKLFKIHEELKQK